MSSVMRDTKARPSAMRLKTRISPGTWPCVIKEQFWFAQVRFKELSKNTGRLQVLFVMSNLWLT
jgi:hypothetical protein